MAAILLPAAALFLLAATAVSAQRNTLENLFRTPNLQIPAAVVIDIDPKTLPIVKEIWRGFSPDVPVNSTIVLSTYHRTGFVHTDTFRVEDFVSAVLDLSGRDENPGMDDFSPTLYTVLNLTQGLPASSAILLFTGRRPTDEKLEKALTQSLIVQKCQLLVAWTGSQEDDAWRTIQEVAVKSGGEFVQLTPTTTAKPIENVANVRSLNATQFEVQLEQVRFPESGEIDDLKSPSNKPGHMKITETAVQQQQRGSQQVVIPIMVELAKGTTLEVRPGTDIRIQYEVTNNQNIPVSAFFNVGRPENVIITSIQPQQAFLPPLGTTTVQLSLISTSNSGVGSTGTITLIVQAAGRTTSRTATIYFVTTTTGDNWAPDLWYRYEGDCKNHMEPHNCDGGQWSLEATIRDEGSGLLRVMSEPYGLLFKSEFIAGTKSQVYVTYLASCCRPKFQLWAEDLKGNYVKKDFDVYNQGLLGAEIAAIVVGIILFIVLIIVIIAVVILCRRRNRTKIELPRHRAGSR